MNMAHCKHLDQGGYQGLITFVQCSIHLQARPNLTLARSFHPSLHPSLKTCAAGLCTANLAHQAMNLYRREASVLTSSLQRQRFCHVCGLHCTFKQHVCWFSCSKLEKGLGWLTSSIRKMALFAPAVAACNPTHAFMLPAETIDVVCLIKHVRCLIEQGANAIIAQSR